MTSLTSPHFKSSYLSPLQILMLSLNYEEPMHLISIFPLSLPLKECFSLRLQMLAYVNYSLFVFPPDDSVIGAHLSHSPRACRLNVE
jgi:hypothetical protein